MMMMVVMVISVIFTWSLCSWTFRKTACVQWNTHPWIGIRGNLSFNTCHNVPSKSATNPWREMSSGRRLLIKRSTYHVKKMEKFINDIHERWYTLPGYQTVLGDTQIKVKILKIHKQLLDIKRKLKGTFNHWIYYWYYIAFSLHVRSTIIHSL